MAQGGGGISAGLEVTVSRQGAGTAGSGCSVGVSSVHGAPERKSALPHPEVGLDVAGLMGTLDKAEK